MLKPALAIVLTSSLLMSATTALGADRISVYTEQLYPLHYTESGGNDEPVLGYATQLVVAVLEEAGMEYEISMLPWPRVMQEVSTKENTLAYSIARTAPRENQFHWIGEIFRTSAALYGLKKNANWLPRTVEEAAGFRIGVVKDYPGYRYFTAKGFDQLITVRDPIRKLQMLQRGRIDLITFNRFRIGMFSEKYGFNQEEFIRVIELEDISTGLYMAFSKSTNSETVSRVQDAYARVKESGKFDEIMAPLASMMKEPEVGVLQ